MYSEVFNVVGKIDLFDTQTNTLIERKSKVKKIYHGYILQLYAQLFCMEEQGYSVQHLCIHSLRDNKRYPVDLPTQKQREEFAQLLKEIRTFSIYGSKEKISQNKLDNCIYKIFYA